MLNAVAVGNLGQDAETREAGETTVVNFSVATTTRVKNGQKWEDQTTWVRCALFGSRAESIAEHLTKGKLVAVRGSLFMREYETKKGETGHSLEMRVDDIKLLGGKKDTEEERPSTKKGAKK